VFAVPADWVPEVAARGQAALAARSKTATSSAGSGAISGLPAKGTTWVYGYVERMFSRPQTDITVQVLQVDGQVVEEAVSAASGQSARRVINASEMRILEQPVSSSVALVEIAPYLLAANGGKAPADVIVTAGYPLGGSGLPAWVYRTTLQDWEQITVPAGTFRALRIDIDGVRERPVPSSGAIIGSFRITAWYAPEIKRLIRLEHKMWTGTSSSVRGRPIGDEMVELLSYRPPS
jgi:hypothetical protein